MASQKGIQQNRDWIQAKGQDSLRFLNGLWTADLRSLTNINLLKKTGATLLLDRKGMILGEAIFLQISDEEFLFSLPKGTGEEIYSQLDRYLVADKVELKILEKEAYQVFSVENCSEAMKALAGHPKSLDQKFVAQAKDWGWILPRQRLGPQHAEYWIKEECVDSFDFDEWDASSIEATEIEQGIPRWGRDYGPGDLPLEFNLYDRICFVKGCYVGQETIARAVFRGKIVKGLARFRVLGKVKSPIENEDIVLDESEKPVGKITHRVDDAALGILRFSAADKSLFLKVDQEKIAIELDCFLVKEVMDELR